MSPGRTNLCGVPVALCACRVSSCCYMVSISTYWHSVGVEVQSREMVTERLRTLITYLMGSTNIRRLDRITLGCGLLFALVAIVRGSALSTFLLPWGPFRSFPILRRRQTRRLLGASSPLVCCSSPSVISAKLPSHILSNARSIGSSSPRSSALQRVCGPFERASDPSASGEHFGRPPEWW